MMEIQLVVLGGGLMQAGALLDVIRTLPLAAILFQDFFWIGVAMLLVAVALVMCRTPRNRQRLLVAGLLASASPFLFFLFLPGVCKAATMPCRTGSLPATLLVSGLQMAVVIAALIGERRQLHA